MEMRIIEKSDYIGFVDKLNEAIDDGLTPIIETFKITKFEDKMYYTILLRKE